MPLPPLILFSLVSGLAASLAGRRELRTSPRPIALTQGFASFVTYAVLVIVPATVYFYIFHGDWFLLYTFDVQQIPSAIALVGFMLQAALGALAFLLGAVLVRNQREAIVGVLIGLLVLAGGAVVFVYLDRLSVVGDHAQFHRGFGLEAYEDEPILTGGLTMAGILLVGLAFLLARLWASGRRG